MPTSLTYIVPSTRGCSPWRPAAVMGTAGCQCNPLPRIFTGPRECTGRRQRCDAWPGGATLSRGNPLPGCTACRKEKRTLPGTRAGVSELARVAAEADGRRDRTPTLHSGSGMLTRFPFGTSADRPRRGREPRAHWEGVNPSLRTDSPTSKCCSRGTLPHFSLQSSHLNRCYYHQDLHRRRLHRGPRTRLRRHRRALLHVAASSSPATAGVRCDASAPSIFRAG